MRDSRSLVALLLVCVLGCVAPCQLWGQTPVITTVAGNGTAGYSGDNDSAITAKLNAPYGVAVDSAGNFYIPDFRNQRVRKVDTSGIITTIAGNGIGSFAGDNGPATSASLYYPNDVAIDGAGNVYIADMYNQRIRKVDPSGIITTIAGDGTAGYAGDNGPATSARLNYPSGVAVDSTGNVYIADMYNQRIRKVDASGTITTVAGNGNPGYSGDNGSATSASLQNPRGVAVDSTGNLYIAAQWNQRIRKVDTSGVITTIAGNGAAAFTGDNGIATNASLNYPSGVTVDSTGDIYIADTYNQRVRRVDASGIITTIAGDGTAGYAGDNGPPASARLYYPNGVTFDSVGNLYLADTNNFRVRKVTLNKPAVATHFVLSTPASVQAGTAFSFTVTALDQFEHPTAGYKGTVHFTSTDTEALVLPADYTFTGPDKGMHTFAATLKTAGDQAITVTDIAKASLSGTSNMISVSDFSLYATAPAPLSVGGSGSAQVSVGSLFGFNSAVTLSVSGMPAGVTTSFSTSTVTPPAGGSANSTLHIGVSPGNSPSTFTLIVSGNSGGLTHSATVSVTVIADISSLNNVINKMTAAGCIDNRGVSNALIAKVTAAQTAIRAGNIRTATNLLNALLQQISAQSGKHIATSCTASGTTFSPVDVLTGDIQILIATLAPNHH